MHLPPAAGRRPAGCDPDTIKLFIGKVPKRSTEEDLLPLFEQAGRVLELVVVRCYATRLSKGSAFVWYTTRAMAVQAILSFHGKHVLRS